MDLEGLRNIDLVEKYEKVISERGLVGQGLEHWGAIAGSKQAYGLARFF